jgi:uncharacterized protein with HEPN domain
MNRERQYLLDMLNSARLAMQYTADKSESAFNDDVFFQDAVIRRIEIIGEAARRISPTTQAELTDVPWKEIIGMRNILTHQYDGVSLKVVWQTVKTQFPQLIPILERAIATINSGDRSP